MAPEPENSTSTSLSVSNFTVQAPEQFTFCPEEWPRWKQRFDRFRIASGLSKKSDDEQINTLIYIMGQQADEIFLSLKLSNTDKTKYSSVIKAFEDHFIIRHNVIYERAKFNSRNQLEGEKVEDFITALYTLSEHCKYDTLREEMIRDRLVVGVRDKRLSEKLQLESDLTLDKAVQTIRQSDAVHRQQQELIGHPTSVQNMHAHTHTTKFKEKNKQNKQNSNTKPNSGGMQYRKHSEYQKQSKTCDGCGSTVLHKRSQCPAQGKQCNACKKWNHFSRVCKSLPSAKSAVHIINEELNTFLGNMYESKTHDRWTVNVSVRGKPIEFAVDTGAPINALPLNEYEDKFRDVKLQASDRTLTGPTGKRLTVKGKMSSTLQYKGKSVSSSLYVVRDLRTPLLSLSTCEALQILSRLNSFQSENTKTTVRVPEEFPELFRGLGCLPGEYCINLKSNAIPYAVYSARRVPIPLMEKLCEKLKEMEHLNVIRPVEEPTEWCAPVVIVNKPNGDIRLCVDLTKLNASVKREQHPMPVTEHSLAQLSGAKYFSKLDANSGFWQIKLAPSCQKLTTFITPYGRYCFQRLPFGITSAPEHFQRKIQQIMHGLQGVICHMDDILVFGATIEDHDAKLRAALSRLKSAGVTLNKDKCIFGTTRVNYLGHHIDQNGIRPTKNKVEAIKQFPRPSNIAELRRFLGLVNYLGKFVPNLSHILRPLNDLLRSNVEFTWNADQETAFEEVKHLLTSSPTLAMFDPKKPTTVSADASAFGIGAVLQQDDGAGQFKPVAYASRTLSECEKRYAQIEKEALAITWASERFKDYLTGIHFSVETDHKPLIPIFSSKNINDLTPRLQRLRMRMMRFSFTIRYTPGKQLVAADALSRQPLNNPDETDLEEDLNAYVVNLLSEIPATDEKLGEIQNAQRKDEHLQKVSKYTQQGWPDRSSLPVHLQEYWNDRFNFSLNDGLLMHGSRIVIPKELRKDILERIHTGHLGIVKCRARAKASVWWPGCSKDIEEYVGNCITCTKNKIPRQEPLISSNVPERPWEMLGADLFTLGSKQFLIVADYYSRYPEIAQLRDQSSLEVIRHLKSMFARHGIPDIIRSDNGPQFASREFRNFTAKWKIRHITSSPRYPQSNGFIEAMVKVIKAQLKDSPDPYVAIMEYRATPLANGLSPAELLMGRRVKTFMPTARSLLQPKGIETHKLQEFERHHKEKQTKNFNRRHGARAKPELEPGDIVWIRDIGRWGTVLQQDSTPRSYKVETNAGTIRRNSFHLNKSREKTMPYEPGECVRLHSSTKSSSCSEPANTSPKNDEDNRINEAKVIRNENVETESATNSSNSNPNQNQSCSSKSPPYVTRSGRVVHAPSRLQY